MGGRNPYIKHVEADRPEEKFTVTFVIEETGEERVFEVDPEKIPYGRVGLEGAVLDLAYGADIDIEHSCGGVCACATCHVIVEEGLESCNEATDDEEDMLDTARGVEAESRLSCQCVPSGKVPLRVRVPAWNKNLVKEGHH